VCVCVLEWRGRDESPDCAHGHLAIFMVLEMVLGSEVSREQREGEVPGWSVVCRDVDRRWNTSCYVAYVQNIPSCLV
jgi:hypothetical protein